MGVRSQSFGRFLDDPRFSGRLNSANRESLFQERKRRFQRAFVVRFPKHRRLASIDMLADFLDP
jgi:hypothetical protein